ncbi:prolyl oligopeptidase family serine peptidase [Maribellus sp. CM-23]|uniref:carboxylesterase family protein n=1 Tax=Maribellus sp. CM-23 TaxID=2781026 RepID=UPI001F43B40F|nr:prolyl oligopeptidase family serine peptidase [Maribellus sp. CM-23]MCE4562921.1 prolyl oligopeptidase family serine peptidase [Maribellus sp. CM-23]
MRIKLLFFSVLFLAYLAKGQQTNERFVVDIDYLLYMPEGYENDTTVQWPLMMFLHGAGEQGIDLEKVKVHGPPMMIEQGHKFPFIVISPQARRGWNTDMLYKLMQNMISTKRIDPDRVYLTGLSMGGFGTWKLAIEHPEMFAAIAPICGGGNAEDIWKLRHMPVWCFHGADDTVVPLSSSEKMVNALKNYNKTVKFTVYPGVGHDSWVKAYDDSLLYDWLLQQKRFRYKQVEIDTVIYQKYTGEYLLREGGVETPFNILVENGKLIARVNNRNHELKPASETIFFLDENQPIEFHFNRNEEGKIDRIKLFEDKIIEIEKIK